MNGSSPKGAFFEVLASFLFLLFLPSPGEAQKGPLDPRIENYPPSSYGAHPQVLCLDRDSNGGMWFGTSGMVLHHTGEEWEKIPTRSGMAVLTMDIDAHGRIWIGGTGEFGYLRPQNPSNRVKARLGKEGAKGSAAPNGTKRKGFAGKLEYVSLIHLLPDSLKDFGRIWDVLAFKEKVVFRGKKALYVLHPSREEGSDLAISPVIAKKAFFNIDEVDGMIWAQDLDHGIFSFSSSDLSDTTKAGQGNERALKKVPGSEALADMQVNQVLEDVPGVKGSERTVIAATYGSGLYLYYYRPSFPKDRERVTLFGEKWSKTLSRAGINQAFPMDPGANPYGSCLALSTPKSGSMLLDTAGRPVFHLNQKAGIGADHVWETIGGAPGSGMLWSATNKGITRWEPGDPRTYARGKKSFSGTVTDISRHMGRLFIATQQGLYVREEINASSSKEWHMVEGTSGQCNGLHHISKNGGKDERLLVAHGQKNLLEVLFSDGSPATRNNDWTTRQVSHKNTFDITTLPRIRDRRWIAYGGGEGVVLLSREGEGWTEQIHLKGLPGDVASLEASTSGSGEGVALWSSFRSKGGFRLILDSNLINRAIGSDSSFSIGYDEFSDEEERGLNFISFVGKEEERKGLPKGRTQFFTLAERIVAATDSGLFRPSEGGVSSEGSFRWSPDPSLGCSFGKCKGKGGKEVAPIFRLRQGEDSSIWVQSGHPYHLLPNDNGGYRIDSLPFKGMGLGTVRAIHPDGNGITWFGGDNGLVRYDKKIEKNFEREYPCLIREVSSPLQDTGRTKKDSVLFGGFYHKSTPNDPLLDWKRVYEQPKDLVPSLPYRMNGLTFRFAAPYYEEQESLSYSYRLQGFNEEWSEWKKETRKEYTNLPEGTYSFRVKAKNVYGVESQVGEYRFRILPPWYRTWTAYGGYSLAGIGLIWLISRLNSRRLLIQKQRLEQTVEERTREIREQQKETERQKEEVERAHQALEESHWEITASIDYAQKIQNALLQREERISDHFPDHFILFKPQATVSGDFYWTKERNGHLYFAAVDCTGHGVPGAFMSMLGISQLNEIMAAHEEPSPGEILTELRERVVRELSGSGSEEGTKDGMDAALIKTPIPNDQNLKAEKVEFAGANNPLYVVKEGIVQDPKDLSDLSAIPEDRLRSFKKSSDGIEVKGDKMAVGYEPDAADAFTTVELEVPKGAMLYLFSDGYADQFGGDKGKKFRYGPFKELLARIHTMTPSEQKVELDRVFEEWKAGQEQVDDVCVMGVRV